jgi:hypothetical protein
MKILKFIDNLDMRVLLLILGIAVLVFGYSAYDGLFGEFIPDEQMSLETFEPEDMLAPEKITPEDLIKPDTIQ